MLNMLQSRGASFIAEETGDALLDLVKQSIEELPKGLRKERYVLFDELLGNDPEYLREIKWYFFVNMHNCLTDKRPNHKPRPQPSPEETRSREAATKAIVEDIKSKILGLSLSYLMPNGKPLAECTGNYCIGLGGNLAKIGRKVGKRRVGDVLTDADLKAIQK